MRNALHGIMLFIELHHRNTTNAEPAYSSHAWMNVSKEAKNCVMRILKHFHSIGMLCKDQDKRISIQELLKHPWLTVDCKDVLELRKHATPEDMFKNYVLQIPSSTKIYDELQRHSAA